MQVLYYGRSAKFLEIRSELNSYRSPLEENASRWPVSEVYVQLLFAFNKFEQALHVHRRCELPNEIGIISVL